MNTINHQKQKHRNVNGPLPHKMENQTQHPTQNQTTMQTTQTSILPAFTSGNSAPPASATQSVSVPVSNIPSNAAPAHPIEPVDRVTAWRIESLKRKQRADSFYNSLSDEESTKLFAWMDELKDICDIHQRIAAPPPEGLGRKVSLTSLRRLRANFMSVIFIGKTEETLDMITDME